MDAVEPLGAKVPWESSENLTYGAYGQRRVLILFYEVPGPDCPEAVARRDGHLTEEAKEKLRSEKVPLCPEDDEVAIVWKRYKLDKKKYIHKVVECKEGKLVSRKTALEDIAILMNNMEVHGVVLYYVGAGRRDTGDWCFSDGYITFKDIVGLYQQAPRLRQGRVLTIICDCSYSGKWVLDCERFLDSKGVQPCGHKARDKEVLIKVYASCLPTQIPTRYQLTVYGSGNDKETGDKYTESSKYLLETQHTFSVNSSRIRCSGANIRDPCTLKVGFTWEQLRRFKRIYLEKQRDENGQDAWSYVELEDNEETVHMVKLGKIKVSGSANCVRRTIKSGMGKDPPVDVEQFIQQEFGPIAI